MCVFVCLCDDTQLHPLRRHAGLYILVQTTQPDIVGPCYEGAIHFRPEPKTDMLLSRAS